MKAKACDWRECDASGGKPDVPGAPDTQRQGRHSQQQLHPLQAHLLPGQGTAYLPRKFAQLTVLRIRDILVGLRIRGSVLLTNGSDSGSGYGSCHFRQ